MRPARRVLPHGSQPTPSCPDFIPLRLAAAIRLPVPSAVTVYPIPVRPCSAPNPIHTPTHSEHFLTFSGCRAAPRSVPPRGACRRTYAARSAVLDQRHGAPACPAREPQAKRHPGTFISTAISPALQHKLCRLCILIPPYPALPPAAPSRRPHPMPAATRRFSRDHAIRRKASSSSNAGRWRSKATHMEKHSTRKR